jgi:riboflavin kinase/FMN adenylyltransferase
MRIDGAWHDGVASFGRRPTFDDGAPRLETFVFDFSGDLYGRRVDVAFVDWLRGEEKFDSLDALIAQMDADGARARAILAKTAPFLP